MKRFCSKFRFSARLVRSLAIIVMVGSFASLVFGRGFIPLIQGFLGMIASMEGYIGAKTGNKTLIGYFAVFLLVNAIASIAVGAIAMSGIHINCYRAQNVDTCVAVGELYGFVMLAGSSTSGIAFALLVYIVYRRMEDTGKNVRRRRTALLSATEANILNH